jgi:hypothetical protein
MEAKAWQSWRLLILTKSIKIEQKTINHLEALA